MIDLETASLSYPPNIMFDYWKEHGDYVGTLDTCVWQYMEESGSKADL